jgi:hypothetical protein
MARIVVGSPNLTQPLLLYPGLGPAMLEQHRRSSESYKEHVSISVVLQASKETVRWSSNWNCVLKIYDVCHVVSVTDRRWQLNSIAMGQRTNIQV